MRVRVIQLTSTVTHKDNHINKVETFIALVKQSQKVIVQKLLMTENCSCVHLGLYSIHHSQMPAKRKASTKKVNVVRQWKDYLLNRVHRSVARLYYANT